MKMKITITREDWDRGVHYADPCGCLLARALKRQTGKKWSVSPGQVDVEDGQPHGEPADFTYNYEEKRNGKCLEEWLDDAHNDPDLLPITIELVGREGS